MIPTHLSSRQTHLGEFGLDDHVPVHDHAWDFLWTDDGDLPPCKRSPGDPGWEPSA